MPTMPRVDETRGERMQVECPDCDSWVVLLPTEGAKRMALDAIENSYPGATAGLSQVKIFTNRCACGSQITLTATRHRGDPVVQEMARA